jgi:hypothetical protein
VAGREEEEENPFWWWPNLVFFLFTFPLLYEKDSKKIKINKTPSPWLPARWGEIRCPWDAGQTRHGRLWKSTQRTTTMGDLLVVIIDTRVDWGLLS